MKYYQSFLSATNSSGCGISCPLRFLLSSSPYPIQEGKICLLVCSWCLGYKSVDMCKLLTFNRFTLADHVDYLGIMSESVLAHFELIESRLSSKAEKSSLSLLTTKSRVAKKVSKEVIQKYADNLPDSEKTAFKAASDILEHLRSIYDSKVYFPSFVTHRVERILQGLEIFMNLLEIHNSEPGRLLVGGVHCIFTVGTSTPTSELGNMGSLS